MGERSVRLTRRKERAGGKMARGRARAPAGWRVTRENTAARQDRERERTEKERPGGESFLPLADELRVLPFVTPFTRQSR